MSLEELRRRLGKIAEELREVQEQIEGVSEAPPEPTPRLPPELDTEEFRAFLRKPYVIIPKGEDSYYIAVPRFLDVHFGWLERQTETYNVFVVDRYTYWFDPEGIPQELRDRFKTARRAEVVDGYLRTSPKDRDYFWKRYRRFLLRREDEDTIRIKRGYEFELIASLIGDGILPFRPQPVREEDLREWRGIELRDYQQKAWEEFRRRGAIGIFWPPGVGKSYFGIYVLARIKGRKLVVVPTRTLAEQWRERIRELIPEYQQEVEVVTYSAFHRVAGREYSLVVFDEVHHLPAPTFVRLSTLRRKYTLGLSATPYREDGKEAYVLALTGYPVGMDWMSFLERGMLSRPEFRVRVVKSEAEKLSTVEELVGDGKRTIVFCDSLRLGERISKLLGVPFVHSKTRKRLETIRDSRVVVVSRVGDEGVSLPDVERVVEVSFLGRSRRQQVQRFGRLLHSAAGAEHVLIMTEEEFQKFYSRVYAVEEKGFRVAVERY